MFPMTMISLWCVPGVYDKKMRLLECGDDVNLPKNKNLKRLTNQYFRPKKKKQLQFGRHSMRRLGET